MWPWEKLNYPVLTRDFQGVEKISDGQMLRRGFSNMSLTRRSTGREVWGGAGVPVLVQGPRSRLTFRNLKPSIVIQPQLPEFKEPAGTYLHVDR